MSERSVEVILKKLDNPNPQVLLGWMADEAKASSVRLKAFDVGGLVLLLCETHQVYKSTKSVDGLTDSLKRTSKLSVTKTRKEYCKRKQFSKKAAVYESAVVGLKAMEAL